LKLSQLTQQERRAPREKKAREGKERRPDSIEDSIEGKGRLL